MFLVFFDLLYNVNIDNMLSNGGLMFKKDYRSLTIYEIIHTYRRIVTKVTKNKHYYYGHPSLKREDRLEVIKRLMNKLQMNETQALFLYDNQKMDLDLLKIELIKRDQRPYDFNVHKANEFVNRIKSRLVFFKYHQQATLLISISIVLTLLLSLFSQNVIVGLWIVLVEVLLASVLVLYAYLYYYTVFKMKKAIKTGKRIQKEIKIYKYRFRTYLETNRRPPIIYDTFGLNIYCLIDGKKTKLFYPFLSSNIVIRPDKNTHAFKEKMRLISKLNEHDKLEVTYLNKTKIIVQSSIKFERLLK